MMPEPQPHAAAKRSQDSALGALARVGLVLAGVMGVGAWIHLRPTRPHPPAPPVAKAVVTVPSPVAVAPAEPEPPPKPKAAPPPPAPVPKEPRILEPDHAAIAAAEAALDEASRDRARADARLADLTRELAIDASRAALDARRSKTLAYRVRDPSARIAKAAAQGGYYRGERDRLKAELEALAWIPRPKAQNLVSRNPVARPAEGKEFHFEVRRDRVAFIDLDRLIQLVESDARLKIRLSDGRRALGGQVGPVGAFSLRYELTPAVSDSLRELLDGRIATYDMAGWEVVPAHDSRGESRDTTLQPASEFGRAIRRLSPESSSVTLWVYPDGFALYRQLRDDLHARGFLVSARPMPAGLPIRGSPTGSLSAGQ